MYARSMARRLGTFGAGALVVGAVLVGTGVAVSARTVPHAVAGAIASKKTTTTTSTTVPPPTTTTTTQPCAAHATTVTSGAFSLTATPGTCIVNGTPVVLTGTGFTPGQAGTFLECNSDANQPTVLFEGSQIPISCTNPLSKTQGPGIILTSPTGGVGPSTFTVGTGPVGPPCGPSQCTGPAATDSSGGNTFTDAGNYPCPPTAAQVALNDTCQIIFGDQAPNESVTIDLAFNPNLPPPSTTPPTAVDTVPPTGTGPATKAAAKPNSTKASSGSLAFTGAGPGLWWLALVGILLMVFGAFALILVDQPRRLARVTVDRVARSRRRSS
jgi:hypothetical protein